MFLVQMAEEGGQEEGSHCPCAAPSTTPMTLPKRHQEEKDPGGGGARCPGL